MENRIREHRKKRNLTIEQLADMVGTTKGYLSNVETGKRVGSVVMLQSIAQALGVRYSDIFPAEHPEEQQLIAHMEIYQKLSTADQQTITRLAKSLLSGGSD